MSAFRILLSGRRRGCPWTAASGKYFRMLPSSPSPLPLPAIASSSSPRYFSNGLQPSPGVSRAPPPFLTAYPRLPIPSPSPPPPSPLEPVQETHPYAGETLHAPGADADELTIVCDRTSAERKYAKMQTILGNLYSKLKDFYGLPLQYLPGEGVVRGKINVLLTLDSKLRFLLQTHRYKMSCLTEVESDCLMHISIGLKKLTNLLGGTLIDTKSWGKEMLQLNGSSTLLMHSIEMPPQPSSSTPNHEISLGNANVSIPLWNILAEVKIPGDREKFSQEIQLIDHIFESLVLKHTSSRRDIDKYVKELCKLFPLVDGKLAKAYVKQHVQRLKKVHIATLAYNFCVFIKSKTSIFPEDFVLWSFHELSEFKKEFPDLHLKTVLSLTNLYTTFLSEANYGEEGKEEFLKNMKYQHDKLVATLMKKPYLLWEAVPKDFGGCIASRAGCFNTLLYPRLPSSSHLSSHLYISDPLSLPGMLICRPFSSSSQTDNSMHPVVLKCVAHNIKSVVEVERWKIKELVLNDLARKLKVCNMRESDPEKALPEADGGCIRDLIECLGRLSEKSVMKFDEATAHMLVAFKELVEVFSEDYGSKKMCLNLKSKEITQDDVDAFLHKVKTIRQEIRLIDDLFDEGLLKDGAPYLGHDKVVKKLMKRYNLVDKELVDFYVKQHKERLMELHNDECSYKFRVYLACSCPFITDSSCDDLAELYSNLGMKYFSGLDHHMVSHWLSIYKSHLEGSRNLNKSKANYRREITRLHNAKVACNMKKPYLLWESDPTRKLVVEMHLGKYIMKDPRLEILKLQNHL